MGTIYQSIEILSKEKGIDPRIIVDAVKDAMLAAARKQFRANEELTADFDERTGAIQIYSVKNIVEEVTDPVKEMTLGEAMEFDRNAQVGGQIRFPKKTEALGRISAQTAKQVIMQKVREAERDTIFNEFHNRVSELVTCTIKRNEMGDFICDVSSKTEARLPRREQSRLENFQIGDRVRCVIKTVERSGKNAGVILSRADCEFVKRLFEQEVPEIYDNTVVIKACAREAGERTKIAVSSRDRDVDSVGACVGMKGMRVQSIIRELRGEKIDIIEFSEDPVQFATHALSPAKISRVTVLDPNDRHMEVIVDDNQLSLAIGKKGQNVRLAAKLIGWKIDIKSEEEKRREVEAQMAQLQVSGAPLSVLADFGLGEKVIERLFEAGIGTVERLGAMTPEEIMAIPGINTKAMDSIQAAVNGYYGPYEEEQPAEAAPVDGEPLAAEATEGVEAVEEAVAEAAAVEIPKEEAPEA
ncbi:MAG: transcription termination/antitermination protein NusA [Acidobacteria bacterium]|nr:transcription termination/antitermination protein NusA [Acidobacteriota bacterium]